jgi:hypothetical protein
LLTRGVHRLEAGRAVSLAVDPKGLMAFDASGRALGRAA